MTDIVCGGDVSSEALDARIGLKGPFQRFPNTAEGAQALAAFCQAHGAGLAAMEASGGYETKPFAWLWALGMPVAVCNPRQVRRFADAPGLMDLGLIEKTDKIDAGVIARFAEVRELAPCAPASARAGELKARVGRLRQLTALKTAALKTAALKTARAQQRRHLDDPDLIEAADDLLAMVEQQIRTPAADIAGRLDDDPLWRALEAACRSIKGVAERTVATLMADLPEIGNIRHKAIAKRVGLAPIANHSGKSSGRRTVRAGRSGVRALLFTVAEIVRRYDPDFADFHRRLNAAGKPKKLVRIALAHKRLTQLNAKARETRVRLANAT